MIKGQIAARQRLLAFREVKKNGIPHCGLVYDKALVPVVARPRRAFQGWRYLEAKDAPPDLARTKGAKTCRKPCSGNSRRWVTLNV